MDKDIEQVKLTIITASATAQVLHETLDDLEGTSYYKQTLKMATKRLQVELAKTCDDQTNALWGVDEKSMTSIQNGILEICKQVAKADPVRIAAIGDMLKHDPNALLNQV